jgi:hypothetical protein
MQMRPVFRLATLLLCLPWAPLSGRTRRWCRRPALTTFLDEEPTPPTLLEPPRSYEEMLGHSDAAEWKKAMDVEMAAFSQNGVYEIEECPATARVVGCR